MRIATPQGSRITKTGFPVRESTSTRFLRKTAIMRIASLRIAPNGIERSKRGGPDRSTSDGRGNLPPDVGKRPANRPGPGRAESSDRPPARQTLALAGRTPKADAAVKLRRIAVDGPGRASVA